MPLTATPDDTEPSAFNDTNNRFLEEAVKDSDPTATVGWPPCKEVRFRVCAGSGAMYDAVRVRMRYIFQVFVGASALADMDAVALADVGVFAATVAGLNVAHKGCNPPTREQVQAILGS